MPIHAPARRSIAGASAPTWRGQRRTAPTIANISRGVAEAPAARCHYAPKRFLDESLQRTFVLLHHSQSCGWFKWCYFSIVFRDFRHQITSLFGSSPLVLEANNGIFFFQPSTCLSKRALISHSCAIPAVQPANWSSNWCDTFRRVRRDPRKSNFSTQLCPLTSSVVFWNYSFRPLFRRTRLVVRPEPSIVCEIENGLALSVPIDSVLCCRLDIKHAHLSRVVTWQSLQSGNYLNLACDGQNWPKLENFLFIFIQL